MPSKQDDEYRGALKNYGKSIEPATPAQQPPAKKRRVDVDSSDDPVDAKLNQIRGNMEQKEQSSQVSTTTPSKKGKAKNKNKKNKIPQPLSAQTKQSEFDYSSVDFKKFAGGSIIEQKNEIKMKFQGKVRYNQKNDRFRRRNIEFDYKIIPFGSFSG